MTLSVPTGPFESKDVALDLWHHLVYRRPREQARSALVEHLLDVLADAGVELGELDVEIARELVEDLGAEHVQVVAGWLARAARRG